jgi:hypothetical protein
VDVHCTVGHLPALVRPGGHVIWTRHRREPDLTPAIRGWLAEAGFSEIAFDTEPGFHYGVGTHVLTESRRAVAPLPATLFTFVGDGAEAGS